MTKPREPASEVSAYSDFSALMGNCVHDIKNSLGLLMANLDRFDESFGRLTPEQRITLNQLNSQTRRINSALVQLLAIYKSETKGIFANIQEVDAREFLEEVVAENVQSLALHGIELEAECAAECSLFCDPDLVRSVINAVVNNACRYANGKVTVAANERRPFAILSVFDDGEGYPPGLLGNPLMARTDFNTATGGTGLGIYFAGRIAALHQNRGRAGRVEIDNLSPTGGGRFRLFLP